MIIFKHSNLKSYPIDGDQTMFTLSWTYHFGFVHVTINIATNQLSDYDLSSMSVNEDQMSERLKSFSLLG